MALTDIWDQAAAESAVKAFVDLVLADDASELRVGRRNAPANMSGSVSTVTIDGPRHDGSVPVRFVAKTKPLRQVEIVAAAPGPWTLLASGGWAAGYVAAPGDTPPEIRDGLLASVVPGSLPITVTASAPASILLEGDTPGVWFAVASTEPPGGELSLLTIRDAARIDEVQQATWRARIQIHLQAAPGATPRATGLASRVRSALLAHTSAMPVVDPTTLSYDYGAPLRAARMVVQGVDAVLNLSAPEPGTAAIWNDIAAVTVDFGVLVGIRYSSPTLASASIRDITITEEAGG
jgi:hypothetical protein